MSRNVLKHRGFDVVGIGANTLDHLCVVPRPVRPDAKMRLLKLDRQPGGQVPTALVALQRWGMRTAYVGTFGDDDGGRIALRALQDEHVDTRCGLMRAGVRNQESIILVDAVTGERSVLWDRPAELSLRSEELPLDVIADTRLLLLDAYDMNVALAAARHAKQTGAVVMLDVDFPQPGIEELLRLTDLAIVSAEFLLQFSGGRDLRAALRRTASHGPSLCGVTLGPGGALALAQRQSIYVPAFRRPLVDSTGAGDVFHAGCAYGVLQGWNARDTLLFAAAAAALNCEKLGARAGIPTVAAARALAGS